MQYQPQYIQAAHAQAIAQQAAAQQAAAVQQAAEQQVPGNFISDLYALRPLENTSIPLDGLLSKANTHFPNWIFLENYSSYEMVDTSARNGFLYFHQIGCLKGIWVYSLKSDCFDPGFNWLKFSLSFTFIFVISNSFLKIGPKIAYFF